MVVTTWGPNEAGALQAAMRLTNERFAEHLGIATRTVANWRSNPEMRLRLEMQQLLDTVHSRAADDVLKRFEQNLVDLDVSSLAPLVEQSGECSVTSHKFVMAQVDIQHVRSLVEKLGLSEDNQARSWFNSSSAQITTPFGEARLYVWPFGSVACHLIERNEWSCVAELAMWRVSSYPANLDWLAEWLSDCLVARIEASYVISAYWVHSSTWSGEDLVSAAHLLSAPKSLLPREPQGTTDELAASRAMEQTFFNDQFRHSEVQEFGVSGTSVGAASWSGVAYAPIAVERALGEADLVECELAIQALWAYCDRLSRNQEQGNAVSVDEQYSWHFLKRARSRLNMSRPQETGQHKSMRKALVETSGVDQMLDNTIELMKEV